jgi:hypothetical protein
VAGNARGSGQLPCSLIEEVPMQKLDIRQYITMQFADGNWNTVLTPRVTLKT